MADLEHLVGIVRDTAQRLEVLDAVLSIYAAVQKEIDALRPLCVMSGRCCRFEEYGHRLYVSTIELAAFTRGLEQQAEKSPPATDRLSQRALPKLSQLPRATNPGGCPFQVDKLCGVHPIRPFGCRMFFCDPAASEWQNQAYERFHAELKTLHEQLSVPYFYVEWRSALSALGLNR